MVSLSHPDLISTLKRKDRSKTHYDYDYDDRFSGVKHIWTRNWDYDTTSSLLASIN